MKKIRSKIISLILCAILLISCAAPGFAAAVPEGVTNEDVLAAIPKTEKLVSTLLSQNEDTADLSASVYGALFSDATLNAMLTGIYSAFADSESTFTALGIDISVASVAAQLEAYPEVHDLLASKQSWSEVVNGSVNCRWNVKNKEGFSHAVAGMLGQLNPLLYTLLCGGKFRVSPLVSIDGDNGYQNGVVPILRALGCPSIMSQEEFTAAAKQNSFSMVKNILGMLYADIDTILAAPVDRLCTVLPSVAYFLQNGGLSSAVDTLIAPLNVQVGLFRISGLDKILAGSGMLSDPAGLTDLIGNMDIGALTGTDVDLQLPEFDLAALAACCTFSNDTYTSDKASAFCEILRWALKLFRMNRSALLEGFGGMSGEASGIVDGLLAKSDDEIIKLLLELFNLDSDDIVLEYQWTYPAYVPGSVVYTPNLGETEYTKVLTEIDDTLNEFMTEFGDGSLTDTLSSTIYSSKTLTGIVKALYGALYTEETAAVLGMIGLDASPAGIADGISSSYPSAARTLARAAGWDSLNENAVSWGFNTGSREGFVKALVAVLRPIRPFLDLLLAEGSIDLLGAIRFNGSNGYNTAVIPLLEALGCRDVRSYAQYKSARGTDDSIRFIIDPVCDLLDDLIEKPVATICEILPNIVYFVNSGGIKQCVENLIYPVKVMLDKFGMASMMPQELSGIGDIDVSSLITQLSEDGTLPFKLPTPDLSLLSSLGTAEQYDSKRTYHGLFTNYTYIRSDAPAVLVTVLRYVIDALSDPANGDGLSSLMGGDAMAGNDMFAMYAGNITEQFKSMTTDEIIEWLYDLLFRETPKKEIVEENEVIPTIIYQPKNDHAALKRALLIIFGIGLPTLLVVYLSKRDVTDKKERKKRKKQKKEAAKAERSGKRSAAGNGGTPTAASPAASRGKAPAKAPSTAKPSTAKPSGDISFADRSRSSAASASPRPGTEKSADDHRGQTPADRELAKLRRRQEKAARKALREAKKADRYYEQALKEAEKRK